MCTESFYRMKIMILKNYIKVNKIRYKPKNIINKVRRQKFKMSPPQEVASTAHMVGVVMQASHEGW